MKEQPDIAEVREIMLEFAERTGLSNLERPARRYLWTDAHAACNFLSLYRRTGKDDFLDLALALIDQVHNVLGRHRQDDPRSGWISGLGEEEGRRHPTAGGLRIGKHLKERRRDEPYHERAEWDRDGQYFHYLTKWMHALSRAGAVTGDPTYCRWAAELAQAAQAGFTAVTPTGGTKRLMWKMSIDLSYPLVPSTGLHDPLDGYVTYHEIAACAARFPEDTALPDLDAEVEEAAEMYAGRQWHTDDPLGIGGLLFDATRVVQLIAAKRMVSRDLAEELISASLESLNFFVRHSPLDQPARHRLAFRELGLAIGLAGVEPMRMAADADPRVFAGKIRRDLDSLDRYVALIPGIQQFWRRADSRREETWTGHLDINTVMLATSLLPQEYLSV